jgi:hypothetical protein
MRDFPYITVGKIMRLLHDEGVKISRPTFYKLEAKNLFSSVKSAGGWRVYNAADVAAIVQVIKENYKLI